MREALLRDMEECEWRRLFQFGEQRARERVIGPEDVADISRKDRGGVDDWRQV